MIDFFEDLVASDENTWLEFKSYWYWNGESKKKEEGWNELLKDVSAMFNTISLENQKNPKKYIIFGYDEKTKEHNNYFKDKSGNNIDDLMDLEELKKDLIKKIRNRFSCYPEFKNSSELYEIESLIEIEEIKYSNTVNLVLTIHNAPYLLQQKSNTGKGTRNG
ncbi:hypothetical protein CXF65_05670, partial [Psychrobacter sp. Sarcosine-3u-12]